MSAKEYFRSCLTEHQRLTGETYKIIALRLGNRANWIAEIAGSNEDYQPALEKCDAYAAAIPTLDADCLRALILERRYPQAAATIAQLLDRTMVVSETERQLLTEARKHREACGASHELTTLSGADLKRLGRTLAGTWLHAEAAIASEA